MNEDRETKECRFCREQIDARARRCPHCRMQQTKWAFTFHPAVLAAGWLLLLLVLGFWAITVTGWLGSGRAVQLPEQLDVVQSQMVFEDAAPDPFVAVVGIIRNTGHVAWRQVQVEVQFFDGEGHLVDTVTDVLFNGHIGSGNERGFRVSGQPYLSRERYASHRVVIRSARRVGPWW